MLKLNRFRHKSDTAANREPPVAEECVEAEARGPELMLLVNDAACRSGLRLHSFADAESAASFIEFWFPPAHRHGLIAFWALPERPEAAPDADFALLVRNPSLPGIVHPLSFPDEGAALSCLASELGDGLEPSRVLAYWTVPIAVATGPAGEAELSPLRPPVELRAPAQAGSQPGAPRRGQEPDVALPSAADMPPPDPAPARREPRRSLSLLDLLEEARKVLRTERWPVRSTAFQGFGSPRGRF
jgi:hypothetical protein